MDASSLVRRATSCDRIIIELIEKIKQNDTDLVEANFSHKTLGSPQIGYLCDAIKGNTTLRSLKLSHCKLREGDLIK